MKTPLFSGTCTALVTPFEHNAICLRELDRLLDRQLNGGVSAILLCGTTGEAATLSDEEKLLLLSHTLAYVHGRCRVIFGCGSNDTAKAVHLAQVACDYGADGLLAVTPYYNKTSQEGLLQYYRAICEASSLPVVVYNVPGRTGMHIELDTYRALAEIEQINGVKEASGNVPLVARLVQSCGDRLHIWAGNDEQAVAMMALGAKGVISVASNVVPEEVVSMVNFCLTGNFRAAAEAQGRLMALIDTLFSEVNPLPVKQALAMMGYRVGACRPPLYLDEVCADRLAQRLEPLLNPITTTQ